MDNYELFHSQSSQGSRHSRRSHSQGTGGWPGQQHPRREAEQPGEVLWNGIVEPWLLTSEIVTLRFTWMLKPQTSINAMFIIIFRVDIYLRWICKTGQGGSPQLKSKRFFVTQKNVAHQLHGRWQEGLGVEFDDKGLKYQPHPCPCPNPRPISCLSAQSGGSRSFIACWIL